MAQDGRIGEPQRTRPGHGTAPPPAVAARQEIATHRVFFPAAMLLSAVEIPLWAALHRARPELAVWHAHEMLFGYALAVVTGFLLARLDRRTLAGLALAWLVARLAAPLGATVAAGIAALGFALGLGAIGARRFLRAARKGRNQMFAFMLLGMAAAEAVYQGGALGLMAGGEWRGALLMLDLVSLIMLQMGGRVIPAATAGALARRGIMLRDRVQPWVETALGALMVVVIAADQVAALSALAGGASVAAAALALFRLLRWRGWLAWRSADLLALHIGYLWLVLGLALKGLATLAPLIPLMAGVHAIAIGALGTLTLSMMLRTAAARGGAGLPSARVMVAAVALMGVSAGLRMLSAFGGSEVAITVAAGLWAAAMLLGLIQYGQRRSR